MAIAKYLPECLPGCVHEWDIETAKGATSRGVCRICKQEAWFSNVAPPEIIRASYAHIDPEMQAARRLFLQTTELVIWNDKPYL